MTLQRVAVFGAGTMGAGIAQVCLQAGHSVTLCEPAPDAQKRAQKLLDGELKAFAETRKLDQIEAQALRDRLTFASGLDDCEGADLVIEAVFERLDVKQELFSRLDRHLSPPAILATNTNALSVTAIASKTRFPDRVCGLHFFNPPTQIKLVEVSLAQQTSTDTADIVLAFARGIGKVPIKTLDSPGFVVNRCLQPFYGEALRCLAESAAKPEVIDRILRSGGFRTGAFEEMDRVGLDTCYNVTRTIWESFFRDGRYRPHSLLKKLIEAGHTGLKSGHGFYDHAERR